MDDFRPISRSISVTAKDIVIWKANYSAQSWASVEYCIYFMARFGNVHAFGYNFAKSEPNWIKSGAL